MEFAQIKSIHQEIRKGTKREKQNRTKIGSTADERTSKTELSEGGERWRTRDSQGSGYSLGSSPSSVEKRGRTPQKTVRRRPPSTEQPPGGGSFSAENSTEAGDFQVFYWTFTGSGSDPIYQANKCGQNMRCA